MRGIGGPLLCIGDLLSDVGEENEQGGTTSSSYHPSSGSSSLSDLNNNNNQPLPDLTKLFQENYDHLNEALNSTDDHSWTSLTLKLCTSLDTANKLVQCTNSNVASLLEKVQELEKIVKRGDSAIAATKAFYVAPDNNSNSLK
ncbi:unnamed protein product [Vicia faba]|uniref:Uncharacterized protein n=1 Tax=Vicia faba TaxID=3906 RepID=A0AAV0YHG1_VICFA|nr:unnamed protein product [Vicia faba]